MTNETIRDEQYYVDIFISNVKEEIADKSLTFGELSRLSDVDCDRLKNIFSRQNGKPTTPNIGTAVLIAQALKMPLEDLCGMRLGAQKSDTKQKLLDLLHFVVTSDFDFDVDNDKISMICEDRLAVDFINSTKHLYENTVEVEKILDNMFRIHNKNMESDFNLREDLYIWGEPLDEFVNNREALDFADDETIDLYNKRFDEWENTKGCPKKYLCESYKQYMRKHH